MTRRASILAAASAAAVAGAATGGTETVCVEPALAIPDPGAVVAELVIAPAGDGRVLLDLDVLVVLDHAWVGDLRLVLEHTGSGRSAVLLDRPGIPSAGFPGPFGCGGDDVDARFDDEAVTAAESACALDVTPVLAGALRPLETLATFDGVDPVGTWQLRVEDAAAFDAGSLGAFCLVLETAPDCNGNGQDDAIDIASGASEDLDGDGVPDECSPCPADVDGDGEVGFSDLVQVLAGWGPCVPEPPCSGDLDEDGAVGFGDVVAVLAAWGPCR